MTSFAMLFEQKFDSDNDNPDLQVDNLDLHLESGLADMGKMTSM